MNRLAHPFLFFGQGTAKSRKALECLAQFQAEPNPEQRARLVAALPEPMRYDVKWTGPQLRFGSDDSLGASVKAKAAWQVLCGEIEAWALQAHAMCPLGVFVKGGNARGSWHAWSCKALLEQFSKLPLAQMQATEQTKPLAEGVMLATLPDEKQVHTMPLEERRAMWRWISGFDTRSRHGAYDPLAKRLLWLVAGSEDMMSLAQIDRMVRDAGVPAVQALGRDRAIAACVACQQTSSVLEEAFFRSFAFSEVFKEDWAALDQLMAAVQGNAGLQSQIEEAERVVFERTVRNEAPRMTSMSNLCFGGVYNWMRIGRYDGALWWLEWALQFSHPVPAVYENFLVAMHQTSRGAEALRRAEADKRFAEAAAVHPGIGERLMELRSALLSRHAST